VTTLGAGQSSNPHRVSFAKGSTTPKNQRRTPNSSPVVHLGKKGGAAADSTLSDLTEEEKLILKTAASAGGGGADDESSGDVNGGSGGGGGPSTPTTGKKLAHLRENNAWCFMFANKGVDPKNHYMRYWDLYTIALLVYTAIVTPYEAGL
jgi:hypothetical protein